MVRHNTDTTPPAPHHLDGRERCDTGHRGKDRDTVGACQFRHMGQEMGRTLRTVARTSANMREKAFELFGKLSFVIFSKLSIG